MNTKMENLRAEARKIVCGYKPNGDFEAIVRRLAGVGYRMMDALAVA